MMIYSVILMSNEQYWIISPVSTENLIKLLENKLLLSEAFT